MYEPIFNDKETYHLYYREQVCIRINNKKDNDQINYPYFDGNNNTLMSYLDNFNKIVLSGSYIGQYEIINSCIECRYNIVICNSENINDNEYMKPALLTEKYYILFNL